MSLNADIFAALGPIVGNRVYPSVAPAGAGLPRIVYTRVGGEPVNYAEGTLTDREGARLQITVWAKTALDAEATLKAVDAAVQAAFGSHRLGGPISSDEPENGLYGLHQDYEIWFAR